LRGWRKRCVQPNAARPRLTAHSQSDDLTPFLIPALGRHYADWSIDDSNHASALDPPPLDRFRAEDISDERLPTENVYMGPLAERLIAAMTTSVLDVAGEEPSTNGDIDMSQEIPGLGAPPAPASESAQPAPSDDAPPLDAIDLEERLRRELRFLGVFPANPQGQPGNRAKDGDVDWSSRTDDEISAELKACQRLLSEQISVNDATKARLAERVKDRMARQEYEAMRDSLEKTIESGYLKRQRTLAKRKAAATAAQTAPPPASRACSPAKAAEPVETSDKPPPISAELAQAMYRRQKLIEGVYQLVFANAEPGRFMGMPEG
jgi:transcriptional adapter 3